MVGSEGEVDPIWDAYVAQHRGREPRPFVMRALELAGAPGPGSVATDLGCGAGSETFAMLRAGWDVTAIDSSPAALDATRLDAPEGPGRLTLVQARLEDVTPPRSGLIHASFALPFCPPEHFDSMWTRIVTALEPGGLLAVMLFGERDSWAAEPDMTFHDSAAVERLTGPLEVIEIKEHEHDGASLAGPKHWHFWTVLARAHA